MLVSSQTQRVMHLLHAEFAGGMFTEVHFSEWWNLEYRQPESSVTHGLSSEATIVRGVPELQSTTINTSLYALEQPYIGLDGIQRFRVLRLNSGLLYYNCVDSHNSDYEIFRIIADYLYDDLYHSHGIKPEEVKQTTLALIN